MAAEITTAEKSHVSFLRSLSLPTPKRIRSKFFMWLFYHLLQFTTRLGEIMLHLRFDDVLMFDHLEVCVLARMKYANRYG